MLDCVSVVRLPTCLVAAWRTFEIPKSKMRRLSMPPSFVTKMLSGLRSQWRMQSGPSALGRRWALERARATGVRKVTACASESGGLPSVRRAMITSLSVSPSSHSRAMNGTSLPSGSFSESNWSGRTTSGIDEDSRNITSPSFWKRSRKSARSAAVRFTGILRHLSATGAAKRRWFAR